MKWPERVLAGLGFKVRCRHCGHISPVGGEGDHTCPCPYSDDDCPDHLR